MQKLKTFIDSLPCGQIGTIYGYQLWKYEANEGNLDNWDLDYLKLSLGETWFNTEEGCPVTAFKDLDTFDHYKMHISICLYDVINFLNK
jgi:hypothetical protein